MDLPFNNIQFPQSPFLVFAIYLWSLLWKGLALWRAAEGKQRNWFIILLILNTIGILEIITIFSIN